MGRETERRVRVGFFDFASCEGCQLQVLNLENELAEILQHVEIVNFREAMSERMDNYVVAFVEGSITRPSDIPRIKEIREKAEILVALGACAVDGCVNANRNVLNVNDVRKTVYGDKADYFDVFDRVVPVSEVVGVDYEVEGCPIDRDEFLTVLESLLAGKKPHKASYPVCLECQIRENVCMYDLGEVCLGPIIRGGCKARCPSNGFVCNGCRGVIKDSNLDRMREIMHEYGLKWSDISKKLELFNSWSLKEVEVGLLQRG